MAKLWITEFGEMANQTRSEDIGGVPQVAKLPSVAAQVVTFTTSAQSAALNPRTRFVRIISDANCHALAGANPTATTSNMRIVADAAEYFAVEPGQKIAVVAA